MNVLHFYADPFRTLIVFAPFARRCCHSTVTLTSCIKLGRDQVRESSAYTADKDIRENTQSQ